MLDVTFTSVFDAIACFQSRPRLARRIHAQKERERTLQTASCKLRVER
jgi:hypothetical protein